MTLLFGDPRMILKTLVHKAEEGGFWAEVPVIPGCATQGDTLEELKANLAEAIKGCLSAEVPEQEMSPSDQVIEIAV
jgi:predicted RNase H-like HicB family nuclease